ELGEVSLDDIDWRLLHELQRDGRAPYTRLAHVIGLSQAATRARVVRLMRSGVIQVTGLADPLALGAAELGGFGLVVTGGLRKVAEAVAAQDGVRYLATGFGRYDIVGQAEATSRSGLVAVLDAIRSVPGVTVRESWHHLDVVKECYAVELPDYPLHGSSCPCSVPAAARAAAGTPASAPGTRSVVLAGRLLGEREEVAGGGRKPAVRVDQPDHAGERRHERPVVGREAGWDRVLSMSAI